MNRKKMRYMFLTKQHLNGGTVWTKRFMFAVQIDERQTRKRIGYTMTRKYSISINLFYCCWWCWKFRKKEIISDAVLKQNTGSNTSYGLFCLKIFTVKKTTTKNSNIRRISIFPRNALFLLSTEKSHQNKYFSEYKKI